MSRCLREFVVQSIGHVVSVGGAIIPGGQRLETIVAACLALVRLKMVRGSVSLCKRRFHGLMRPMKLKASVRMSGKSSSSPTCLSEMTAVMSCWKANSFDDTSCTSEIKKFLACAEKAAQEPGDARVHSGYKWSTDEVNQQLRRFVWAQ